MGVETYYDEYGNSDLVYVREEPNCYICCDSGEFEDRHGRVRRCRECYPTRLDLLRAALRWRWFLLTSPLRGRRAFTDEPPF